MELRKVLTIVVFTFAAGAAIASELFLSQPAYVSKAHIPQLTEQCQQIGTCNGDDVDCVVSVVIDGIPLGVAPAFDGTSPTDCGQRLRMANN
jgi:hypothetical protein